MRTKLYLLAVVLMGIFHASLASELYLKINQGGKFQVTVGAQQQVSNLPDFKFYNINPGQQRVIVTNTKNGVVIFNNLLNVGMDQRLIADLSYNGVMNISQIQALNSTPNWGNEPTIGSVNYGSYGNPSGNYGTPNYGSYPGQWPNGQPGWGTPNYGWGYGSYPANNMVDNTNFQALITNLKAESFDSDRLTTATNYAKMANLSAVQIAEITKTFTYDSSKLDFAKAAYNNCYDKQNYFQLKSAFTYSSTYDDLMEEIQQ